MRIKVTYTALALSLLGLTGCPGGESGSGAVSTTTLTVVPSFDPNLTSSPAAASQVAQGATQSFQLTPASGYLLQSSVGGTCPSGTWSGTTYTTGAITANCTVAFSSISSATSYSVNISIDAHTASTPSSTQSVLIGSTLAITVSANTNFTRSSVVGGTCPAGSWVGNIYTTGQIVGSCTVSFSSAINTFSVVPSVDGHTTITPGGAQTVAYSSTQAFSVTSATGYTIAASVGGSCPAGTWSGGSYTTGVIISACTLSFTSTANTYQVGGTMSGLTGTVVLQDNAGDNLSLSANGNFTFPTSIAYNASFAVTVLTQPTGQVCTVANGSGTMGAANVTSVSVSCLNVWTNTVQDGTAGGSASAQALAVATDSSRNVFVVGKTTGAIDSQAKIGTQDFYLAKYNNSVNDPTRLFDFAFSGI